MILGYEVGGNNVVVILSFLQCWHFIKIDRKSRGLFAAMEMHVKAGGGNQYEVRSHDARAPKAH